jgi:hypothetical protein
LLKKRSGGTLRNDVSDSQKNLPTHLLILLERWYDKSATRLIFCLVTRHRSLSMCVGPLCPLTFSILVVCVFVVFFLLSLYACDDGCNDLSRLRRYVQDMPKSLLCFAAYGFVSWTHIPYFRSTNSKHAANYLKLNSSLLCKNSELFEF